MKDRYVFPAILSLAADGISVEFPDLPGCLTCGDTEEEALRMAQEALALHIWGMEDDGDLIPQPARLADLTTEKNQVVTLVEAWMPPFRDKMANKAVKKTLTIPKWLNDLAEAKQVNFSHVLQAALKNYLGVRRHE
ncbi:MAG: type II toxin-antitoxin system HicB family antitoxin [Symbiobacteriia bacterium]